MPKDNKTKSSTKETTKDVKSKHNAATDKAGLSFNVNTTRNWIKKQFDVLGIEIPKFHGAHIALTAIIESLLQNVITHVNSQLPKEKSSLYKITLPALSYPLQLDTDYSKLFKDNIATFDVDTNYTEQFWMTKYDINYFIECQFGNNIQIEPKAYNLLSYLLLKYAVTLTKTAHYLMTYAGKRTMNPKAFKIAVQIHTPETIANTIIMKLDDAISNFTDDGEGDEEENDDDKESKKSTKESKDKKKVAKEVSSDSEDSASDNSDSDSESESESEPEEKPSVKSKKGIKSEKISTKDDKKVKAKK